MAIAVFQACGWGRQHPEDEQEVTESPLKAEFDPQRLQHVADTVLNDRGLRVALFTEASLVSKYENLFVQVTNADGDPADSVSVDFHTYMDMGMMSHGGPYSPPEPLDAGWFRGGAVFIMPDVEDMGRGWLLKAQVTKGGKVDSLTFKLPVTQARVTRTLPFDGGNDGRFFVSLLLPDTVPVGKQPVDFILHHIDHNAFPTADGYTLKLETYMPDMGHGSKDNRDAANLREGRYQGTANLSMAGLWEIHGTLLKDGKQVSTDPIVFKVQAN